MTATMKRIGNGEDVREATPFVSVRMGDSALSNLTDSDRFSQLQRVATMMGGSALTPKHLKGSTAAETVANCFRVVNQAMRWGFDPFAVGDETYVVSGKLGYQGKLVAAVINARAGLVGRLSAAYKGTGDARTVTISGQFATEDEPRTIEMSVAQGKTANALWTKDPDQKLFYSGVTKWARRHCPELILGVMTVEDLEGMQGGREPDAAMGEIDAEIMASSPVKVEATPTPEPEKVAEAPANEDADPPPPDEDAEHNKDDLAEAFQGKIVDAMSLTGIRKVEGELNAAKGTLGEARFAVLQGMLAAKAKDFGAGKK